MRFLAIFLAFFIFNTGSSVKVRRIPRDTGDWKYSEQDNWGGECRTTNRQSPINIIPIETKPIYGEPLVLTGAYRKKAQLINSGNIVTMGKRDPAILVAGSLDSAYSFQSLHFHYGSEHTINGVRMDAEAHFVHFNMKYAPQVAASQPDGIAVVAVFLVVGNEVSPRSNLLERLAKGENVTEPLINAFPDNLEPWFRYEGSLTTPPCTSNVVWTVLQTPIYVDSLPKQSIATPTYREVQPTGNRTVYTGAQFFGRVFLPSSSNKQDVSLKIMLTALTSLLMSKM